MTFFVALCDFYSTDMNNSGPNVVEPPYVDGHLLSDVRTIAAETRDSVYVSKRSLAASTRYGEAL